MTEEAEERSGQEQAEEDEPAPETEDEAMPAGPPEDLVDRAQDVIADGMSRRNLQRR